MSDLASPYVVDLANALGLDVVAGVAMTDPMH
jgi:hypothetical protein